MFNGLLCSESNSSLTCPVRSNCQFNPGKRINFQRSEHLINVTRHVNKKRTEGRIHIYLHAFINESSHYVSYLLQI